MSAAESPSEIVRTEGAAFAPVLAGVLASRGWRRALLVARGSALGSADVRGALAASLSGTALEAWAEYETNPQWPSIQRGVRVLESAFGGAGPDVVVAIGGGSSLDAAKLIAILAAQPESARGSLPLPTPLAAQHVPLVAVPTTSGSGSEATHFATVYQGDDKFSVEHASMLPRAVILHPPFAEKMPAVLAAETGMDALAHAVESLWSRRSSPASIDVAARALRIVGAHLTSSVAGAAASRAHMMEAAYLAGRAIAMTRTTASHALSYHLSTRFGVRHGHAAALTLPWMLEHTAARAASGEGADQAPPLAEKVRVLCEALGVADAHGAAGFLRDLMRSVGVGTRLAEIGVSPGDAEAWFRSINIERLGNHPSTFTRADFDAMFAALA
jgi:alcohol dehydrogenase class IV